MKVPKGRTFSLSVTSTNAVGRLFTIVVDGHGAECQVADGKTGALAFVAEHRGSFEVKVEQTDLKLFELQVT